MHFGILPDKIWGKFSRISRFFQFSDFIKNLQEAFEGGAEKIKQFQHAMDDDIERGEKLKAGLVADGWGGTALIWLSIVVRFQSSNFKSVLYEGILFTLHLDWEEKNSRFYQQRDNINLVENWDYIILYSSLNWEPTVVALKFQPNFFHCSLRNWPFFPVIEISIKTKFA